MVPSHVRFRPASHAPPRARSSSLLPIALVIAVSLAALTGCDSGNELASSASVTSPEAATEAEQTPVSIGSAAELHARLPEVGTPLPGSGARRWLEETRVMQRTSSAPSSREGLGTAAHSDGITTTFNQALIADPGLNASDVFLALTEEEAPGSSRSMSSAATMQKGSITLSGAAASPESPDAHATSTDVTEQKSGVFVRTPLAYGVDGSIQMPTPDATTSTKGSVPGAEPANLLPCIQSDPATGSCGGGGGGGGSTAPSFIGTTSLTFDNVLEEGYATWDAFTDVEGGTYVDEVRATTETDIDVDNGAFQETTPPYTFTRTFANSARAISSDYHYAGDVNYVASGDHAITDDGSDRPEKNSSASAGTNFSASSCAPFPLRGDDGQTYSETTFISVGWQTICPQKNKVLQIERTSGPGGTRSSAQVETGGDGWSISAFEAWNGIFMNNGTYRWTIRASGESATRSGTFSVTRNRLCRPALSIVNYIPPSSSQQGRIDIQLSACTPEGDYRFTVRGVDVDGGSVTLASVQVAIQDSGGDPIFAQITLPALFGQDVGNSATALLDRVSPYNGSARVASASVN